MFNLKEHSHTRLNILTGENVLISPHRMNRPWQGKTEDLPADDRPSYDPKCYLCPGNVRADGGINPDYTLPFSFVNDFSALLPETPKGDYNENDILSAKSESGICKVICFSPDHNLTLAKMEAGDIAKVIDLWQKEFAILKENTSLKYIQIFENKGEIMGCSNPHPHGQIWASSSIPVEVEKETVQQKKYFNRTGESLLSVYVKTEMQKKERIVIENDQFLVVVPFWAVWPYETLIISKRHVENILQFTEAEKQALADVIQLLTVKYDNLFQVSFPYSAGMHQAPVNDGPHPEWHWHMHFYPPLLRSATVKKFMVGYEMLANPQRDITPEFAAEKLRTSDNKHYTLTQKILTTAK